MKAWVISSPIPLGTSLSLIRPHLDTHQKGKYPQPSSPGAEATIRALASGGGSYFLFQPCRLCHFFFFDCLNIPINPASCLLPWGLLATWAESCGRETPGMKARDQGSSSLAWLPGSTGLQRKIRASFSPVTFSLGCHNVPLKAWTSCPIPQWDPAPLDAPCGDTRTLGESQGLHPRPNVGCLEGTLASGGGPCDLWLTASFLRCSTFL